MSIGLGKIEVADAVIYAISIQAPIGQVLLHKKTGDRVRFQGKEIEIQEVG